MKTINLTALLLLLLFGPMSSSFAQKDSSGVYLNPVDFRKAKLTYAINCSTEKHKIKLNEFFDKSYITVIHEQKSVNLEKKNIFGFRDCDNMTYRFVGQSHYTVLNPREEILLYKHVIQASKNQEEAVHYYFSTSADVEVQQLSLTNLKKAFPDNHKFHDMLDVEFNGIIDLAQYDSFHKMYKVNRLYLNSLK
jgi:hypothetical protein